MTDRQSPHSKYYEALQEESEKYGDLRFQNLNGGLEFYLRYLAQAVYGFFNYKFDYFMRMDDDYFLCMEKLLGEVPIPMQREFHWGFVHCTNGKLRPDESITMYSQDILKKFLSQDPKKMRCSLIADLSMGMWVHDLGMRNFFHHDKRLHHHPIVSHKPELREKKNVCSSFIGIHGSFPEDMKIFWSNRGPTEHKGTLWDHSTVCTATGFRHDALPDIYDYEPKLCVGHPTWKQKLATMEDGSYQGREDELLNRMKGEGK